MSTNKQLLIGMVFAQWVVGAMAIYFHDWEIAALSAITMLANGVCVLVTKQ